MVGRRVIRECRNSVAFGQDNAGPAASFRSPHWTVLVSGVLVPPYELTLIPVSAQS